MSGSPHFDVLVLAPHPDDAEIACGGTISRLVDGGRRVAVADMARGEKATRGDADTRRTECEAATAVLGIAARHNLELPDAEVRDDEVALRAVIGLLRRSRPAVMLAPMPRDLHPDHEATGQVARRALFTAGLRNLWPELGEPWRPSLLLTYPLHYEVDAKLCVDISGVAERKIEAVECYATQVGGGEHLATLDPLERTRARDAYWGMRVGVRAAEPFGHEGPLTVDPGAWFGA